MKSINFNTGIKEYAVNGDENNCIRINISDMNIAARFKECANMFDEIQADINENGKPSPEKLSEYDKTLKAKIDYIFDSDVSSHAFGGMNCLSPVGGGQLLFSAFLNAFMDLIKDDIKAFKAESGKAAVAKYMPPEKKTTDKKRSGSIDLSKLTPEQLAYLETLGK